MQGQVEVYRTDLRITRIYRQVASRRPRPTSAQVDCGRTFQPLEKYTLPRQIAFRLAFSHQSTRGGSLGDINGLRWQVFQAEVGGGELIHRIDLGLDRKLDSSGNAVV